MWFLSRPRKYTVTPDDAQIGVNFDSYRGQPDLLDHARSTVAILRGVKEFEARGGEMPKGLLLSGAPRHRQDVPRRVHRGRGAPPVRLHRRELAPGACSWA